MSNDFDDDFEDEEEGGPAGETFEEMLRRLAASGNLTTRHVSDDGEEGESREISVADFLAQMSGVSQFDNDEDKEDDADDDDEEDEEEGSGSQNLFFGIGQNGEVTNMTDEEGGFSFSFTLDEDGEEVPEIRCPKCGKNDPDILDWENDIYRCTSCKHKFTPEIYKVLESADDYLDRSWYNFQHLNFKRAIRDANTAINLEPNNCKAYLSRGKALVERGELEQAESDFSEAIRISPDYDVAFFERGKTRMFLQKFDDAIADFTMSIGFDPDFAETYRLRAVGYCQQERYDDAIKDLSEALKRDPNEAQAWFERGYNYSLLGEHQKAVQDYSEAITRDPNHPSSFVRRAESYEKLERYHDAITDYKNFLRSAGEEPSGELTEKLNALQLKVDPNAAPFTFETDEEVSIWEDVTLSEDSKVYRSVERGEKLLEEGDFAGAYKEFSDFIAHQPKNVAAYIHRACVSFAAGNREGVIEDFTGAINCGAAIYPQKGPFSDSVDPRYDQIHLLRALSYALAGKEEKILPDLIADAKIGFDKSYTSKNWPRHSSNLTANDAAAGKFIRMVLKETENNRTPVQDALLAFLTKNVEAFGKPAEILIQNDPQNPILIWAFGLNDESNEDHPEVWGVSLSYPDDDAEMQFVRGLKSMTAGEFQRGKELIVEAIRLDPDNAEYHEKLGVFLARANDQDDAIGHLTRAIELNPNAKDAYFYRGIAHKSKDEFPEAQADFLQVIELESAPGNTFSEDARQKIDELKALEAKKEHLQNLKAKQHEPLASSAKYIERGQTYLKTGEWEKAYLDFDEAIRLEPTNAKAFRFRGASLYKIGEAELAIKDYSQAIKLDPNNSDLHLNRGILQADSGDSDDALVDLNEAIRLNPSNAMAYHMRAKVHAEAWYDGDRIDQATEDFEKAIELDPDNPEIYKSRAEFWCQPCFRGAEKDALADLDQAIRLTPENAEYYLARFKVKAKLNDATGASEDLTKAFLLDPSNEEVKELVQKLTAGEDKKSQVSQLMMSAMEKINSGDLDGCIEDLKQASKLDPENQGVKDMLNQIPPALMTEEDDSHKALILVKNAHEKFNTEDYEGCITDLTEAITLNPNEELAFRLRGLAYLEKGLEDEAYRDWFEAIRLGNINPEIYFRYVNYCLGNDDYDATIDVLTRAIDRQLELDEDQKMYLFVNRGYAYLEKGMHNESISDSSRAISLKPDDPIAYENRAEAYRELHEYKSAISDYQTFVKLTDDEDDKAEALGFIQEMELSLNSESSEQSPTPKSDKGKPNSDIPTEKKTFPETPKPPLSITETWLQMGKTALEKGLYPDAVLNFDKVIKKEPYNWEATIYYWRAIGGQTDFENEAWDIFFENINQIKSYILNRLTGNERKEALLLISESVHWYTDLYMNLVKERRDKRLYDLENQADVNTLLGSINMFFGGIGRLEDSLTFLDSMGEIEFQAIKHAINKSKIDWITTLCEPVKARMRPSKDGFAYVGIPDDVRFKYIAKYESILDEIVKVEPEFKPEKLIDRLTAPGSTQEALNRPAELAKKQISIDRARQIRIAEYEKQKYWETHPEEYTAYLEVEKRKKEEEKARALAEEQRKAEERKARALAEQKRKQELFEERKQKLQKEIDDHNLKLEKLKRETGREIERLQKERESLGFLAMGKKKEIDQKILSLEKQVSDFAAKTEVLRKELKDLKP